jgi:hypothetical protein
MPVVAIADLAINRALYLSKIHILLGLFREGAM